MPVARLMNGSGVDSRSQNSTGPDGQMRMNRRTSVHVVLVLAAWACGIAGAQEGGPDTLITSLSVDVLDNIKGDTAIQAGDVARILALVDKKIMPHVDLQRMTALAVGHFWRSASLQQQQRLQEQFKLLVVRTYAGALSQVKNQTVQTKPLRAAAGESDVVVRTEVRGNGEPIRIDYRLESTPDGWKIYDVNVLGVWLAENYRSSFAQEINATGIDGLITKLTEKNQSRGRN